MISPSDLIEGNLLADFNCAGKYLFPTLSFSYVPNPDGSINVTTDTVFEDQPSVRQRSELERTCVKQNNIHIQEPQVFFKEMKKETICPFTGGGDIFINKSGLSNNDIGVCLLRELEDTDLDSTHPDSPTSDTSLTLLNTSVDQASSNVRWAAAAAHNPKEKFSYS